MGDLSVRSVPVQEVPWRFDRLHPRLQIGYDSTDLDPFPAYPHNHAYIYEQLLRVNGWWPAEVPVIAWNLPFDAVERTNAHTTYETAWREGEGTDHERVLVGSHLILFAKRIPIHPAMTRYLIAHEYGHAVEDWIVHRRGLEPDSKAVLEEYTELRGLEVPELARGAHTWHKDPAEVFADDFRIVVTGIEEEHWPHAGIPSPRAFPKVVEWWNDNHPTRS